MFNPSLPNCILSQETAWTTDSRSQSEMDPNITLLFGDLKSRLQAVFESSRKNSQLDFATIQLHDTIFRLKLLEEDLFTHRTGLDRLDNYEDVPVDTLRLNVGRVVETVSQTAEAVITANETSLR